MPQDPAIALIAEQIKARLMRQAEAMRQQAAADSARQATARQYMPSATEHQDAKRASARSNLNLQHQGAYMAPNVGGNPGPAQSRQYWDTRGRDLELLRLYFRDLYENQDRDERRPPWLDGIGR